MADRAGKFPTTTGYQNLGALIQADANFKNVSRNFKDVVFHVPAGSAQPVLVAINSPNVSTAPATETSSATVAVGGFRVFDELDLDQVWVKSNTAASVIEFQGTLLYR